MPRIGHFYVSAKSWENSLPDFPEILEFLVEAGIDSIILNLDTAIDTTPRSPKTKARLGRTPG